MLNETKLKCLLDNYADQKLHYLDEFDDAIIGYHVQSNRIVYSVKRIIEIIFENEYRDDKTFTMEMAHDYFSYNIETNGCGEYSPILSNDLLL